ncbi:SH3 domain-containing protein [Xanthobacter sp. V4C-4]|uniref:SH3 domain-containing protein n=1 Tax=Xanthobacter cornucopiae TaxID=3119924 RepID=UPI0037290BDF
MRADLRTGARPISPPPRARLRRALVLCGLLLAAPAAAAPDFADGLMGGPDTWTVSGLAPGATLNLRAAPSTRADIRARLANGTRLANRGCVLRQGRRWCHVAPRDTGAPDGWVSGRYLREAVD